MGCVALVRCVLMLRCGSAGVEWYPYAGWSLHKDTKSQAPEDGCTNIRNMLSSKYWNKKASDIKLVYLFNNQDDARSNKHNIPHNIQQTDVIN